MANELTDRTFWQKYWESKKGLIVEIPRKYTFSDIFDRVFSEQKINSAIELGGFPGYYAVFLKKYYQAETTLLDYFIYPSITKELVKRNGLAESDLAIIEADLFNHKPQKQYDLVLSCGLIEHFKDTKDIIAKHVPFLNDEGTLLITLPNFRGINGWVQKNFDRYNFEKHYLDCMNPTYLAQIAKDLDLKNVEAFYYGRFSTWLENREDKSALTKLFVKSIWYVGKIATKIITVESKALSPYIVLKANK